MVKTWHIIPFLLLLLACEEPYNPNNPSLDMLELHWKANIQAYVSKIPVTGHLKTIYIDFPLKSLKTHVHLSVLDENGVNRTIHRDLVDILPGRVEFSLDNRYIRESYLIFQTSAQFQIKVFVDIERKPLYKHLFWSSNPDSDNVAFYEVYFWQGNDTNGINWTDLRYYEDVDYILDTCTYSSIYRWNKDWIMGGVVAVGHNQMKSDLSACVTQFYHYSDFWQPLDEHGVSIR